MPNHPAHPKNLPGTKWSSAPDEREYRHWEVLKIDADKAVLRATLDPKVELELPWRDLRNREHWEPGWV